MRASEGGQGPRWGEGPELPAPVLCRESGGGQRLPSAREHSACPVPALNALASSHSLEEGAL